MIANWCVANDCYLPVMEELNGVARLATGYRVCCQLLLLEIDAQFDQGGIISVNLECQQKPISNP